MTTEQRDKRSCFLPERGKTRTQRGPSYHLVIKLAGQNKIHAGSCLDSLGPQKESYDQSAFLQCMA